MKRTLDVCVALAGLAVLSPLIAAVALAIWLEDRGGPFYVAPRIGRGGRPFRMLKFRSMVVGADRTGVNSTAGSDRRITCVGRWVRAFKLDEIVQLVNVLKGDMSLVGPRPQVALDASLYTDEEKRMLDVRPGITDAASIVFADEAEILEGSASPDLLYNQVIRPWKSRLALLYIDRRSVASDLALIALTAVTLVWRPAGLAGVARLLEAWGADDMLIRTARRQQPLVAFPPPGATEIVGCYP